LLTRWQYNPYFVQSYGWYESQDAVFITMEFFESGDLQEYMSEVTRMPEEDVQQVAYQILEGLKHMHENDFAHRDLKPSNILVRRTKSKDEDWWVKIGDFGISKRAEEGMTALRTFSGTVGFLAPEVLVQNGYLDAPILANKRGYTLAVDIWSLGEIIYRAICGGSPFVTGLAAYANLKTEFPLAKLRELDISEEGIDLIQKLMKAQPDERLTATQALEHAWFKEIREDSPRSSGESLRHEFNAPVHI
jgi:serine/threonine protein kinase